LLIRVGLFVFGPIYRGIKIISTHILSVADKFFTELLKVKSSFSAACFCP
jgi:hypothetical protein